MPFEDLVLRFGLPLAMLVVVTVAFVRGAVIPRFIYDLERAGRIESERRFDAGLTLATALLDELKKVKSGSA